MLDSPPGAGRAEVGMGLPLGQSGGGSQGGGIKPTPCIADINFPSSEYRDRTVLGGRAPAYPSPPPLFTVHIPIKGGGSVRDLKMCATRGSPLPSLSTGQDTEDRPWVTSSSPPRPLRQEPCRGYPINNFQLHLTLQFQPTPPYTHALSSGISPASACAPGGFQVP